MANLKWQVSPQLIHQVNNRQWECSSQWACSSLCISNSQWVSNNNLNIDQVAVNFREFASNYLKQV